MNPRAPGPIAAAAVILGAFVVLGICVLLKVPNAATAALGLVATLVGLIQAPPSWLRELFQLSPVSIVPPPEPASPAELADLDARAEPYKAALAPQRTPSGVDPGELRQIPGPPQPSAAPSPSRGGAATSSVPTKPPRDAA